MKLSNPFPDAVGHLYFYEYSCQMCGSNRSLELHHITGRNSASAFNACLLCHCCHETMNHNEIEEQRNFLSNLRFLRNIGYIPTDQDLSFLMEHYYRVSNEVIQWLQIYPDKEQ